MREIFINKVNYLLYNKLIKKWKNKMRKKLKKYIVLDQGYIIKKFYRTDYGFDVQTYFKFKCTNSIDVCTDSITELEIKECMEILSRE